MEDAESALLMLAIMMLNADHGDESYFCRSLTMMMERMWNPLFENDDFGKNVILAGTTLRWWVRRETQISKAKQTDCKRCLV